MAAPSLVGVVASQVNTTAYLSVSGAAAGDLAVVVGLADSTAIPGTIQVIIYNGGTVIAGYSQDATVDGSSGLRCRIWSRVLTADDFSVDDGSMYGVGPAQWSSTTGARLVLYVFRHPDGWSGSRKSGSGTHNTNVTAPVKVFDITPTHGSDRPRVAVAGYCYAGAQSAMTNTWDSGSATEPYVDESTSTDSTPGTHYGTGTGARQSDYKLYDIGTTGTTVTVSQGTGNTTHAFTGVVYEADAALPRSRTLTGVGI